MSKRSTSREKTRKRTSRRRKGATARSKGATRRSPLRATSKRPRYAGMDRAIVRDHDLLRSYPGVKSVAIGLKERSDVVTKRVCVKIYVDDKQEKDALGDLALPSSAWILWPEGQSHYRLRRVPTDVVACGSYALVDGPRVFHPAVLIGDEVGTAGVTATGAGTHACMVRRVADNARLLMTAAHVVTTQRGSLGNGTASHGVTLGQPDTPNPEHALGPVVDGFFGNMPGIGAYIDVAFYGVMNPNRGAQNRSWHGGVPSIQGAKSIADITQNAIGMRKVGAVTELTAGLFSAFHQAFVDGVHGTMLKVLEFVSADGSKIVEEGDSGAAALGDSPGAINALLGIVVATSPDRRRVFVVPFDSIKMGFGVAL